MMLATLDTVIALVLGVVALWRITVLVMSGPGEGRVATAVLFVGFAISNGMDAPVVARLLGSSGRIIDNLALIAGFGTFIYFFATQLDEQTRGFIRTRVQVSLAVVAGVAMLGC